VAFLDLGGCLTANDASRWQSRLVCRRVVRVPMENLHEFTREIQSNRPEVCSLEAIEVYGNRPI